MMKLIMSVTCDFHDASVSSSIQYMPWLHALSYFATLNIALHLQEYSSRLNFDLTDFLLSSQKPTTRPCHTAVHDFDKLYFHARCQSRYWWWEITKTRDSCWHMGAHERSIRLHKKHANCITHHKTIWFLKKNSVWQLRFQKFGINFWQIILDQRTWFNALIFSFYIHWKFKE